MPVACSGELPAGCKRRLAVGACALQLSHADGPVVARGRFAHLSDLAKRSGWSVRVRRIVPPRATTASGPSSRAR